MSADPTMASLATLAPLLRELAHQGELGTDGLLGMRLEAWPYSDGRGVVVDACDGPDCIGVHLTVERAEEFVAQMTAVIAAAKAARCRSSLHRTLNPKES